MKVVVTGATGFLGKKVCIRLHSLGYEVIGIGRNETKGEELISLGISFQKIDLEDKQSLFSITKDADYIIHCAALSSPWGSYDSFYRANVVGTKHMIECGLQSSLKRFVHVSTPSLYFRFNEKLNVKEDDTLPHTFVNDYAKTKWLAEQEIDHAFQNGLPVVTIRPRALFGPEDTTIIPRLIRANDEKGIPLFQKGKVLIDLTYVENVVDAILLSMHSFELLTTEVARF